MMDKVAEPHNTALPPVKLSGTAFCSKRLRDGFPYRDLGIAAATGGKVRAQRVIAHNAREKCLRWHRDAADCHTALMLRD